MNNKLADRSLLLSLLIAVNDTILIKIPAAPRLVVTRFLLITVRMWDAGITWQDTDLNKVELRKEIRQ